MVENLTTYDPAAALVDSDEMPFLWLMPRNRGCHGTVTLLACCRKCGENSGYETNRSAATRTRHRHYLLCGLPIPARCNQLCGVVVLSFPVEPAHGRGAAGWLRAALN
jgi:hypothetical protein